MAATCASRGCAVAELSSGKNPLSLGKHALSTGTNLPPVPRVGSWIRIPDGDEGRVEGTMGHDDSPETSIYVRWRSGSARTLLLSEPFEVLGTEEPDIHRAVVPGEPGSPEQAQDLQVAMGLQPRFPEGTPEYAAYRAELTEELGKFARGEEPYPYEPKTTADLNVPPERAAEQAAFYEFAVAGTVEDSETPSQRYDREIREQANAAPFGPDRDELIAGHIEAVYMQARRDSTGTTIRENHLAGLQAVFDQGLAWGWENAHDAEGRNA